MNDELQKGNSVFLIELDKIEVNPYQPRIEFDQEKIEALADSIRQYGVIQPIVVTRKEEYIEGKGIITKYQIIAGERRFRASKLAGLKQIPAIIRTKEDTDAEKLELAIIENLQREDLNPVDKARAFKRLADEFGLKHAEIAKKMGKSRESVSNAMRILMLPDNILAGLTAKKISEGHTRSLLMLKDRPEEQVELYKRIVEDKLTVRAAEKLARNIATDKIRKKVDIDPEIKIIEKHIREKLGTKVSIDQKPIGDGGKLTIEFFNKEDLRKILEVIDSRQPIVAQQNNIEEKEEKNGGFRDIQPTVFREEIDKIDQFANIPNQNYINDSDKASGDFSQTQEIHNFDIPISDNNFTDNVNNDYQKSNDEQNNQFQNEINTGFEIGPENNQDEFQTEDNFHNQIDKEISEHLENSDEYLSKQDKNNILKTGFEIGAEDNTNDFIIDNDIKLPNSDSLVNEELHNNFVEGNQSGDLNQIDDYYSDDTQEIHNFTPNDEIHNFSQNNHNDEIHDLETNFGEINRDEEDEDKKRLDELEKRKKELEEILNINSGNADLNKFVNFKHQNDGEQVKNELKDNVSFDKNINSLEEKSDTIDNNLNNNFSVAKAPAFGIAMDNLVKEAGEVVDNTENNFNLEPNLANTEKKIEDNKIEHKNPYEPNPVDEYSDLYAQFLKSKGEIENNQTNLDTKVDLGDKEVVLNSADDIQVVNNFEDKIKENIISSNPFEEKEIEPQVDMIMGDPNYFLADAKNKIVSENKQEDDKNNSGGFSAFSL